MAVVAVVEMAPAGLPKSAEMEAMALNGMRRMAPAEVGAPPWEPAWREMAVSTVEEVEDDKAEWAHPGL
jgi:hypothetical protein